MNPAGAMGTFIRTWRAEWAGLSRARVAIAVNGVNGKGRRVSEETVRRWEEGQPPKSTEELKALCAVMRKHGLFPLELKQFRQAVFAACADRQFPELFTNDEWVHREDLLQIADDIFEREDRSPGSVSPVDLIAAAADLETVLRDGGQHAGRAHRTRQMIALYDLRSALRRHLGHTGRTTQLAALCAEQAALLDCDFDGDAPGGRDGWRSGEWSMERLGCLARLGGTPHHLARLLEAQRLERENGDWLVAARGLRGAALLATHFGSEEQREYVWQQCAHEFVPICEGSFREDAATFHVVVCRLATRMGLLNEASRHAERFQFYECWHPHHRRTWASCMGDLCLAMGDYAAAARYYEQGLGLNQGFGDDDILVGLRRCEAELQKANRRRKR